MPAEPSVLQQIGTHSLAILVGIAIGAAGSYYGQLFTDQRRDSRTARDAKKRFMAVVAKMPALIDEMRQDLSELGSEHTRTVWVLPERANFGMATEGFVYRLNEHRNLVGMFEVLEENGYVDPIPHPQSQVKKYRLSGHFVDLVLSDRP